MSKSWSGFVAYNQAVKFQWTLMELQETALETKILIPQSPVDSRRPIESNEGEEDGFAFILMEPEE